MTQPLVPRRKILFFDWRDITAGALAWHAPDGRPYRVELPNPPPQVEMRAQDCGVPQGIRLVAQPARKTKPYREWLGWGRIIYDEGRYRTWRFEVGGHAKLCSGCQAHKVKPDVITVISEES